MVIFYQNFLIVIFLFLPHLCFALGTSYLSIKVCSMNVWGLKFITKQKYYRINELAWQFSRSDCEIIAIQELFVTGDFKKFTLQLKRSHPYFVWFRSGVVGSGTAIFSKYLLKKTFFQPFRLNGKFNKWFHGDWFASKGIGHAEIFLPQLNLTLNIITTHLVANYQKLNGEAEDVYFLQRYSQTYELVDYINKISKEELFILLGDFNYNLTSPAFNGIFENSLFTKAQVNWIDFGPTFNLPSSPAYNPSMPQQSIDHVMYGNGQYGSISPGYYLQATNASLLFEDEGLSDHAGIAATFLIQKGNASTEVPARPRYKPLCAMLNDLAEEIYKLEKESGSLLLHLWIMFFVLVALIYLAIGKQFVFLNYFVYVGLIIWPLKLFQYNIFLPQERTAMEQLWNEWSLY